MKIYLAGPMRGIPEFNYPAFHKAADRLRHEGHEVFNPAEQDAKTTKSGADVSKGNATGSLEQAAAEHGFNLRDALALDLSWICKEADGVALLPGWQNSKGAFAEWATAVALGLEVIILETYWDITPPLDKVAHGSFGDTQLAPAIANFDTVR